MVKQLKFLVCIVLVVSYMTTWTTATQNLKGIRCSGKNEELKISSFETKLGDLCPELDIKIWKEKSKKDGDAAFITVEVGDSIIPGNGVQLIQQSFPPKEGFIGELRDTSLSQLSSSEKVCGTGYIYVYISNAEQDILEFDQIKFSKRCTDKPGLSLGVSKNSNTVKSSLKQGMLNPFRAIGIDEIQVVNAPRNCSDCDYTDLQPRLDSEDPDILAVFFPLSWQDTMPEDEDSFVNQLGFSNATGNNWYMEEPEAYTRLIRLGLSDMNMFHSSILLHNQSLHSFDMSKGVATGGTLGKIDLEKNKNATRIILSRVTYSGT